MRRFLRAFGLYERVFQKRIHNGLLMEVCPAEHIQQQLFWHGYYEKQAVQVWEQLVIPGSIVLDIGANTGYYSLVAAPRAAHVYAFEPAPLLRKAIEANCKLNNLENIVVVPIAAGAGPGTATLYLSATDNTGMTGMRPAENFSGRQETVAVMDIDGWLFSQQIEKVDLVKIDVEGAEMEVLQGMSGMLDSNNPVIFIEVIGSLLGGYGHTPEAVFQFLEEKGFKAWLPDFRQGLIALDKSCEADTVIFARPGTLPEKMVQR